MSKPTQPQPAIANVAPAAAPTGNSKTVPSPKTDAKGAPAKAATTAAIATKPPAIAEAPQPMKRELLRLPKDLPPYGKERPLPPIRIEQRKLANGLLVWILPREDGPPKVHFVLTVRGGWADDPPMQPGFSSLLADLLKEGTETRDALKVAQDLQSYGGDMHAEAGVDGITLSMSGLASNAAKVVTLLSEVALQPTFPEHEVEQGKLRALQALIAAQADPDYLAQRVMGDLVYPGHPYSRVLPTQASILSITSDMLQAEHDRRFRPDRALLVIAGRIEPDAAFTMADSVFGEWTADGPAPGQTGVASNQVAPGKTFVARDGSVQSAIRIGKPTVAANSSDYYPLLLTNALVGGSFNSRLNQNLREDKGYTYGAGSDFRAELAGGAVIAYADVRNEVTGAAIGQVLSEYLQLANTPVSDDELAQTKHFLSGEYLLLNQKQAEVASTLADNWLIGLPPQALTDYLPRIAAINAGQVQTMARRYFSPKDQSIVVVGDIEVMPQLKPYGDFSIETR